MSRDFRVRTRSRAGVALTVAVLLGGGLGVAGYLLRPEDPPLPDAADASVVDAALDALAPAKKARSGKKPAARGGKTRVSGRAAAPAHAAAPSPPAHAPPHGAKKAPVSGSGDTDRAPAGPSYDSALDTNDEQVTVGGKGRGGPTDAELTDAQLTAPMSDGAFVGDCGAPESMSVTVKVAIRMGHAVGVSVETSPPSLPIAGCIDRHVRALGWPASRKMDSLVTTY